MEKKYLLANEQDLRYAIEYAEANLSKAYYRMSEHRQIILDLIQELQSNNATILPISKSISTDNWTSGATKSFKGVHSRDIIETILNTGSIERSDSWLYDQLKEMVEDGLLSVYTVVTNSELHREEGFRPGKYYHAYEHSDKFIKEINWEKVAQDIDKWHLDNVEQTEATSYKIDPLVWKQKLHESKPLGLETSGIRGIAEPHNTPK